MANVLDLHGLPQERIVFALSPLAELGSALHVLAAPAHHPGLHGWATATSSGLKPDLADRLCEAEFLWTSTRCDLLLPARPGATLAEELDLLDRIDDETFVATAFEITCNSAYEVCTPSPLVDEGERRRVREQAAARGPRQSAFVDRMLLDPDGLRAWLRRLFEDCQDAFFGDAWERVKVQLAADARHKTELHRRKGLGEALTAASPALSLDGSGSRILVDKLTTGRASAYADPDDPGLTLLPTAFGRPHLTLAHPVGRRPVVQYPVAGHEAARTLSLQDVQQRMDALAHPMRMRLCRSLARGAHTTSELVDTYGITAPEISRHLSVLKKAGLLTTRRRGRYVLHELDLTAVARLGSDFIEGVLR
ncbi:DUF5937 family protein [Streptomyces boluensis]|uniref:Metalloregulator ArsR/SmtB family transcription factor n=1 Tax=Streptomyces boluensis TaxID=1775135 RepID=A0A964UQM9_9ACTN|nr:DUF5937 family protein [Streptomyces boluensis]NBE53554.1 metalloregulator ArsR/SmtB family transcription factor [Streptomyces boluensis]